jgi:hypothetical protein
VERFLLNSATGSAKASCTLGHHSLELLGGSPADATGGGQLDRKTIDITCGILATAGLAISVTMHWQSWTYREIINFLLLDALLFFGIVLLSFQTYQSLKFYYGTEDANIHPLSIFPNWAKYVLLMLFIYGALHVAAHLILAGEQRVWFDGQNYFSKGNDRVIHLSTKEEFDRHSRRFARSGSSSWILFYATFCLYFFFHKKRFG